MTSLIPNHKLIQISQWGTFIPITAKKLSEIIFELQYYGFPVPEPELMKMSAGTVILRYNQFMKKLKEDRENEHKIIEAVLKRTCPLLFKK